MIPPTPTTKVDPALVRGVLGEMLPAGSGKPEMVRLHVPGTNYELHLVPGGPLPGPAGSKVVGRIEAAARRIDLVGAGGRYIEPVAGNPRRVQGMVIGVDEVGGRVIVNAGATVHLKPTDARQRAGQFEPGTMVSCDVLDGATFTPATV
ncbi:MAG TPA: hypothetical protein VD963_02800 [Phycisphaerales bacterium]|nr:hypothetical protein [Phycisphaerales bacterium]